MQRGANMDLRDPDGNTAAHWAFAMGFNDLADFLLAKGANDRIANNQGFTCRNWRRPEPGDGSKDTLSAHGADSGDGVALFSRREEDPDSAQHGLGPCKTPDLLDSRRLLVFSRRSTN
jgi:hypothetical protein